MPRVPETTRASARDSACLGLQVAILLLAIIKLLLALVGGMTVVPILVQDPGFQSPYSLAYSTGAWSYGTIALGLFIGSAPLSRLALRLLHDETAIVCWLAAALAFVGVQSAANALHEAVMGLAWLPTATAEPPADVQLMQAIPDLVMVAVGVVLVLYAPRIALLWGSRMRVTPTPVPAAPAN